MRGLLTVVSFLSVALLLAAPVAMPVSGFENPGMTKGQEGGLRFDSTVTLGNVLTAVAFLVGLLGAYAAFKAKIAVIETKVDVIWQAWVDDHRRSSDP